MGDWDVLCAICASSGDSIETILEQIRYALDTSEGNEEILEAERSKTQAFITEYFSEPTLHWHEVFHALSYNPESPNVKKAYVSGPGRTRSYGSLEVKRGEDPNAPGSAQDPDEMIDLQAYPLPESDSDVALPIHYECLFNILPKVIGFMSGRPTDDWRAWTVNQIDKDVLWEAFQPTLEDYQSHTNLDHYERNDGKGEQYWCLGATDMSSVSNPFIIPSLSAYSADLPRISGTTGKETVASTIKSQDMTSTEDPFGKLSTDLLLHLFDFLPVQDLYSTRVASRAAASVSLLPGYWKKRVRIDMPWTWEVQSEDDRSPKESSVDWQSVYRRLHLDSFKQPLKGSELPGQPGLWNRRRIWMICEQVGKAYLSRVEEQARLEMSQGQDADLARCSFASQVPEVAWKVCKSATAFKFPLILSWNEDVQDQSLIAYWDDKGLLCGLEIMDFKGSTSRTKCKIGHTTTTSQSRIPLMSSNWPETLEIYTSTPDLRKMRRNEDRNNKTGIINLRVILRSKEIVSLAPNPPNTYERISKRLLIPTTGATIIGFQGALEDTENGIVTRFGLLQAKPQSPGPPSNIQFPLREKLAWLDSIPDPIFEPQQYNLGYWNPSISQDLIPRESLIFGRTSGERAHVTGLSVDDPLRRFEVHFDNKPSEFIGNQRDDFFTYMDNKRQPRTKFFPVDGLGGERIIGIQTQVNNLPFELRIMTNRSRQAFFGEYWISRNGEDAEKPAYTASFDKAIGGLYASFGYSSGGSLQLASISVLLVPDPEITGLTNPRIADMPVDDLGNLWEPCQPPQGWVEDGRIYGAQAAASHTVTWIDLSRRITRIEAIQYVRTHQVPRPNSEHLPPYKRVQLVKERPIIDFLKGLRIMYVDGEERIVAGAPADEPEDLSCLAGSHATYEDASLVDGWLSSRWDVPDSNSQGRGRKVERVRLWSDEYNGPRNVSVFMERGPSFGIQFEMEGGVGWGPHFGDCFGDPIAELAIGKEKTKGSLTGLKFIVGLGGNCEHSTSEDVVTCAGAQALVWS